MSHKIKLALFGNVYRDGNYPTRYIPLTPEQAQLIFRECYARLELIEPISGGIRMNYSLWNKMHKDDYMFSFMSEITIF